MRKLFSVLLVLALCGAAIATTTVDYYITDSSGNNSITLEPNDIIDLYLWDDCTGDGVQAFDVCVDVTSGPGTILSGTITAVYIDTNFNAVLMPSGLEEEYDIELMSAGYNGQAIGSGLYHPLARISFKCTGLGTVIIGLYDVMTLDTQWNQITPTMHGMTINQIPEPASVVLLAFGGLAMLGRRKK